MIPFTQRSIALLAVLSFPVTALAQTPGSDATIGPASVTTFLGDSGLWFVPVAEVLPAGTLTAGFLAAREARDQGSAKASYGGLSVARGLGGRAELFGSWQATSAIDGHRGRGDAVAGLKVGLLSQRRGAPLAVAVRSAVKLPVGSETAGSSSGAADLLVELVTSRRAGRAEITASTGFVGRGDAGGRELPNGIRSGAGVAVLTGQSARLFAEIHGETYRGKTDSARLISPLDTPPTAAAGVSWTFANGVSASLGVNRAVGGRDDARGVGAAFRVGFRPGSRRPQPLAPPVPPPAQVAGAPPAPPAIAAAGPASDPGGRSTLRELGLDDVQFDLDRYTLRPDALVVLDRAVELLRQDPALRIQIDGHTCEIGTAEYNLVLGERRASAVRDYLINRGIAADRLQIRSFGKERPKHDMQTEETRALNRRAELRPQAP